MTIGRKLFLGGFSMLGLSMILSVSSLRITNSLGNELWATASGTARKLELAGKTAADSAEMLSAERGLLLRLALGDQGTAANLHQSFLSRSRAVNRDLSQIHSSLEGQARLSVIVRAQDSLTEWLSADEELWQLCSKQDYQNAFKVFEEKVAPKAQILQQAAAEIVAGEHSSIEQEKTKAIELPSQSRWSSIALTFLSIVVGFFVLRSVRNITAN